MSFVKTMASPLISQARVIALILACLPPSLNAFGEQHFFDDPTGCAPLVAASRDARAAQQDLSQLFAIAAEDASLSTEKLNRTLFFASKLWVDRLKAHVHRARNECHLPEPLLRALLSETGGRGEEKDGREDNSIGTRRERRLQELSQPAEKAHKRETLSVERERDRDAASAARRELLVMASGYKSRGISQRSLTKLLAKILALDLVRREPKGGAGQDPGPRLEVDEEEVLHEVPRTFLSLALGSSLIQHHWKKFDTKSPLLLTLTRALSPAVLRMGGSSANFLTYDPDARSQVTGEEEEEEVTINEGEETYDEEREMEIHGDNNNSTFDYFYEEEGREEGRIGGKGEDDPIIGGFNEGEEEKEYDEDLYEEEEEEKEYDEDVYEEEEREKGINISTQLPENEYESEYDINYEEEEGETPITVSTQTPNEDEDESEYDEGDYEEGRENESEFADCKCASSKQVFKNFTMTAHDWRILQDFARDVGMSLLFDVNQFYRRGGDGSWDPTNARLLMRDTSDRGRGGEGEGDVLWQLGNEPNAYNHKFSLRIPPEQTAADYLRLREELDRNFSRAAVVGPDVTRPKKMNRKLALKMSSLDYLATFLSTVKINLTAVTWHQYYVNGRTATLENFLSPEVFDQLVWQVDEVIRVRDQLSPGTPVWLTETSSAWGGGAPGLSNAFVGGFLWLDKLGVAARGGISLVARQTLYDGCYALLDQDLNPYPDYWISVLYKRLVGSRVLKLTLRDAPRTLRLYAHCYKAGARDFVPGSVVIYGENLSEDPVTLDLQGRLGDSPILQYLVQAPEGQLRSRVIMLNGQRLRMTSSNALPHMRPRVVAEGEMVVPATSLGFWVLPHAQLRACL